MDITREQREQRFQNAPALVKTMYDSEESGSQLAEIFKTFQLPNASYRVYATTIGNVVLGFYPLWQLPELLENKLNIPTDTAEQLAAALQPFLKPLHELNTLPSSSNKTTVSSQMAQQTTPPIVGYAQAHGGGVAQAQPAHVEPAPTPVPASQAPAPPMPPHNLPTQQVPPTPPAVPSYRRPMTDIPRYEDKQQ